MSNTGDTTKDSFNQEIYNWRDLISNTLNAIEKVLFRVFFLNYLFNLTRAILFKDGELA